MPENSTVLDVATESRGPKILFDLRAADASYKPFPPFSLWKDLVIDTGRWDRYSRQVKEHGQLSSDTFQRARDIAKRAAAWDTGAIENLYETDRGITFTIACQIGAWESVLDAKGKDAKLLFEAQLQAYDYVLDLATGKAPLVEAWIRELHRNICQGQKTYLVYTEIGPQEQPLPLGEYKHLPNHVVKKDGKMHAYCPVDMTPAEMYRLCEELRSDVFQAAHPALQAAYAHYGLAVIHPFADGNGRVARALASVYSYRAASIPPLILTDTRQNYYATLESADQENYQPFVDFMFDRCVDAIQLVNESIQTATVSPLSDTLNQLKALYMTRGGYSHQEVDEAGYKLIEMVQREMTDLITKNKLNTKAIQVDPGMHVGDYSVTRENFRPPLLQQGRRLHIAFSSIAPAQASTERTLSLEIPKDCGIDDDISIYNHATGEIFGARVNEIIPTPTAALQMRLQIFAERVISQGLQELNERATEALRKQGY